MITFKFNKLGLAYKIHPFNINWTVFEITVPNDAFTTIDNNSGYKFELNNISSKSNESYFYIDWGDASSNTIQNTKYTKNNILESDFQYTSGTTTCTHLYNLPGRYLIKLKNIAYFNISDDTKFVTGIYQLGQDLTSCESLFSKNINLDYINTNVRIPKNVESCALMFEGCAAIETLPDYLLYKDKNDIYSYEEYFNEYNKLNRPRYLANVKNYFGMFSGCSSLKYLPTYFLLSENATNIDSMFEDCTALTDMGSIIHMPSACTNTANDVFKNCISLKTIPKSFNASNITGTVSGTFENCTSLTEIPQTFILNSTVKNIDNIFKDCISLKTIPNTFSFGNELSSAIRSFQNCSSLIQLPENLVTPNTIINLISTFENCTSLTYLPDTLTFKNASENVKLINTFKNCINLIIEDTMEFPYIAESCSGTFENCYALTTMPSNFILPDTMYYQNMFKNCSNLTEFQYDKIIEYNTNITEQFKIQNPNNTVITGFNQITDILKEIFVNLPYIYEKLNAETLSSYIEAYNETVTTPVKFISSINELSGDLYIEFENFVGTQQEVISSAIDNTFTNIADKLDIPQNYWLLQSHYNTILENISAQVYNELSASLSQYRIYSMEYKPYLFDEANKLTNILLVPDQIFGKINISKNTKRIDSMFENCASLTQLPDIFKFPNTLTNTAFAFKNCQNLYWNWYQNSPWPDFTITEKNDISYVSGGFINYNSSAIDINFTEMFANCSKLLGIAPGEILWKASIEQYNEQLQLTISGTVTDVIPDYEGKNAFINCTSLQNYVYIPRYWGGLGNAEFGPYWATLEYTVTEDNLTVNIHEIISKKNSEDTDINYFYINWNNQLLDYTEILSADLKNDIEEKITADENTLYDEELSIYKFNNISHTYETPGTYYVTLQEIGSFKVGQNNQLTDIIFLGQKLNSCKEAISYSHKLTNLKHQLVLPRNSKNFNSMFKNCQNLQTPEKMFVFLETTEQIESMFENCSSLTGITEQFNVLSKYNITNCQNMFKDCTNLTYINENFKLPSSTVSFKGMFDNCISLSSIPTNFSLYENTEDIAYMFRNTAITEFPEGITLLSNIRDVSETFRNMPNLDMNISSLIHTEFTNTRNIDFYMAFKDTPGISGNVPANILWESGLHFTSRQCFKNCNKLDLINVPKNWGGQNYPVWHPTESVFTSVAASGTILQFNNIKTNSALFIDWGYNTNFDDTSYTCKQDMEEDAEIRIYNVNYFNTSSLIIDKALHLSENLNQYNSMFENCSSLIYLEPNLIFNPVNDYSNTFKNCVNITSITNQTFNTNQTNISLMSMFENCNKLNTLICEFIDEDHLPETTVTTQAMFKNCSGLVSLPDCIQLKNTIINNTTQMFQNCQNLTGIPYNPNDTIDNWLIDSITNCERMFQNCKALRDIPPNFKFSRSANSIKEMFEKCESLTTFNQNIELYPVITNAANLFNNCKNLIFEILPSGFNFEYIQNANNMFNCTKIYEFYEGFKMPKIATSYNNMFGNIYTLVGEKDSTIDLSNYWHWYDATGEDDFTHITTVKSCTQTFINDINFAGSVPSKFLWYNQFINFKNPKGYFEKCVQIGNYQYIPKEWGGKSEEDGGYSIHSTIFNITNTGTTYEYFGVLADKDIESFNNGITFFSRNLSGVTETYEIYATEVNNPSAYIQYLYLNQNSKLEFPWLEIPAGKTYQVRIYGNHKQILLTHITGNPRTRHKVWKLSEHPHPNGSSSSLINNLRITYLFSIADTLENCDELFLNADHLFKIDARCSMTKSMKSAVSMFENCTALTEIPSTFHLGGQVSSFENCFKGCTNLARIKSEFEFSHNTRNVKGMFENCTALTEIPSSLYITYNIQDASRLFYNCTTLTEIPKTFKFSKRIPEGNINVSEMFANCTNLETINDQTFFLPPANNFYRMFYKCEYLNFDITRIYDNILLYLENLQPETYLNIKEMFYDCTLIYGNAQAAQLWFLDNHYLSGETVFNFDNCFYGCVSLSNFLNIPRYWGGKIYPNNLTVLLLAPEQNNNIQEFFNFTPVENKEAIIIWGDIQDTNRNNNIQTVSEYTPNIQHTYKISSGLIINESSPYGLSVINNQSIIPEKIVTYLDQAAFDSNIIYYRLNNIYKNVYKGFRTVIIKNVKTFNCSNINNHIATIYNLGNSLESCYNMFANSDKLTSIYDYCTIPNFVSDCSRMFYNCNNVLFNKIPENFKLGKSVRYINSMFENCNNLIDLGGITINEKIEQLEYAFKNTRISIDIQKLLPLNGFRNSNRDYNYSYSSDDLEFSWDNIIINMRGAFENCPYISGKIPIKYLWKNSEQRIDGKDAFKGIDESKIENSYLIPEQWGGKNNFSFSIVKSSANIDIRSSNGVEIKPGIYYISGNTRLDDIFAEYNIQLIQLSNKITSISSVLSSSFIRIDRYFLVF